MKRKIKILLIILFIIIIFGIIFFTIDYNRAKNNQKPLFCIKTGTLLDGGTIEYLGIGYKVIDFHTIAGYDDIKIGTWSMDYDDFRTEMKEYEDRFERQLSNTFIRTYQVLNVTESDDFNHLYITIKQFQADEVETVKVQRDLANSIEANKNYEFTFEYTNNTFENNIKSIFENTTLVSVKETDKVDLDQIQDSIK